MGLFMGEVDVFLMENGASIFAFLIKVVPFSFYWFHWNNTSDKDIAIDGNIFFEIRENSPI